MAEANNQKVMRPVEVYVRQFYDLLYSQSKIEAIPAPVSLANDADAVTEARIWRGKMQDAFAELGVSANYYTLIRNIFLYYDCVQYVVRGTKAYPTILVLNQPPPEIIAPELLTGAPVADTVPLSELDRRLGALEDWRETITGGGTLALQDTLRNFEERLRFLEQRSETNGTKA